MYSHGRDDGHSRPRRPVAVAAPQRAARTRDLVLLSGGTLLLLLALLLLP